MNCQQATTVDCSGRPIYALSKVRKYPEFAYSKYFALFGALLIKKELLVANGQLVGTGLKEILGDTSVHRVDLQTSPVGVNHIHKLQLPVKCSTICCADIYLF